LQLHLILASNKQGTQGPPDCWDVAQHAVLMNVLTHKHTSDILGSVKTGFLNYFTLNESDNRYFDAGIAYVFGALDLIKAKTLV
jgi:hypothetical protein